MQISSGNDPVSRCESALHSARSVTAHQVLDLGNSDPVEVTLNRMLNAEPPGRQRPGRSDGNRSIVRLNQGYDRPFLELLLDVHHEYNKPPLISTLVPVIKLDCEDAR